MWNNVSTLPQVLTDSGNAYIYTGGVAPAEQVNLVTGSVTYLVTDSLGSVRGVVNSSGTLTAATSYDAWGNPETTGGLTISTPFGYVGGYTDPTGLLYLINRYYDPANGQFTSVDPALVQTMEPYTYANANPVSLTDPTGKMIYEYCKQITRFFEICPAYYDHFSSVAYIKSLEFYSSWYEQLSDFYGNINYSWAQYLSYYYYFRAMEYAQAAYWTTQVLNACGGEENPRAGLYAVNYYARAGWWWLGWHYTGWWSVGRMAFYCHE